MRKHALWVLAVAVILCSLVSLTACKNDPPPAPQIQAIEISTPPDKTAYYEGEIFDKTGMVVKKVMDNGNKEAISDYTVDKTGALTLQDTFVTVSYSGFSAKQNITVTARPVANPVELQVLALPAKTVYTAGETFDKTGMEIVYVTESGDRVTVTDYAVDKTVLAVTDTYVTVSYGGLTVKVNITVNHDKDAREVVDVEIYSGDDLKYTRTMDVSSIIKYKAVYSDHTQDEVWTYATAEDLDSFKTENGNLVLELSLFVKNKEFKRTVNVPIDGNSVSVSELYTKTPDGQTVYSVEGIVISVVSTMAREEYIIKDALSETFIGVSGILSTGSVTGQTIVPRYVRGDKVCIPVKLVKDEEQAQYSDSAKVHGVYAGGSIYETGIIEKNANLGLEYANVTQINGQAGLQNFLSTENRPSNHYKLVKLEGPLYIIRYGSTNYHYRFFFTDISSKSLAAQKVDNCSPCFMSANQYQLTEKTIGELLAGDKDWAPTVWADPGLAHKTVYALFIGGNSFYHEFIILEDGAVSDLPRIITSVTASAPQKNVYVKGQTLDLNGAELTVKYNYGADEVVDVTTEMLDAATLPDMNTAGEYTVKGYYENFGFEFTITVIEESAQSIALNGNPRTEYNIGEGFEAVKEELCKLTLHVVFDSGENRDENVTANMILFDETNWAVGTHTVEIYLMGATAQLEITVVLPDVSVTQIKEYEAGANVYNLTGVVVSSAFISGTAASPANGEIILKDTRNANVIGLKGLVTKEDTLGGLAVGDEIKVEVTLVVTTTVATHSECGKIAATVTDGSVPQVLSADNSVALDKSGAVSINSQEEFNEFLKDADTRKGNAYKLVKFGGNTKFVNYGTSTPNESLYITFTGTDTTTIKIDGRQPFLSAMNQPITLGENTYLETMFVEGSVLNNSFTEPNRQKGDVYLMYIGGQGAYYHQFILLGADYVVSAEAE